MQMSSTVSNGLGFASYETGLSMFRQLNEGVTPGPAERGIIAGGAAVTVMAAIQPLEVCCRRMQVRSITSFLDLTPERMWRPSMLAGATKVGGRHLYHPFSSGSRALEHDEDDLQRCMIVMA